MRRNNEAPRLKFGSTAERTRNEKDTLGAGVERGGVPGRTRRSRRKCLAPRRRTGKVSKGPTCPGSRSSESLQEALTRPCLSR